MKNQRQGPNGTRGVRKGRKVVSDTIDLKVAVRDSLFRAPAPVIQRCGSNALKACCCRKIQACKAELPALQVVNN
jgi:hypothetical protein